MKSLARTIDTAQFARLSLALACAATAIILGLLLWPASTPTRADDPMPWESYGGLDGYYIARGWTGGYSPSAVARLSAARAQATLSHTVYLPLVCRPPQPPPPQTPVLRETRALWVTRWDYKTREDIQYIVSNAAYANLNVIFFQVRGQADALYRSGLEPWSPVLSGTLGRDPGWDPLAEIIPYAHNRGIEVHAWINVYPAWLGTTPPPAGTSPLHMYYAFGSPSNWVQWKLGSPSAPMALNPGYLCANPARADVQQRIVEVCQDLLTRYELDGLHFDYVRYADPGGYYSYDPLTGQALAANPGLARGDYQRGQITHLLERVRAEALPRRPSARLTAAVWPVYRNHSDWVSGNDGYTANCQDSHGWARGGLVEGIMPMLYTSSIKHDRSRFDALARDHVAGAGADLVTPGIVGDYRYAPYGSEPGYQDPFGEIAWRIDAARAAGAHGQALFSYRVFNEPPCPPGQANCGTNYWALLRNGPYRNVAAPYWPD